MLRLDYKPWVDNIKRVGQAYVHASPAEIRTVMAGRQSGKSLTGVAEICDWAMSKDNQILWWVTASHKTDDKAWRDLTGHLPKEVVAKTNLNDMHIALKNGSGIWIKSAEAPGSMVSERLDGLVGDEPGLWKSTIWYQGLLPMFNTTKLRVLFISTPRGRNWFYELWMRGREKDTARYLDKPVVVRETVDDETVETTYHSFHWTSYDSPYRNLAVLSEARRSSPQDLFAQEYLAEPIDNVRGVFKNVRSCIKTLSLPTTLNFLGADLARKHDFSAFALMNTNREVFSIQRSQEDWPVQTQRIAAMCLKYNSRVTIDATGLGDPISQTLRAAGLHVEDVVFSNEAKRNVIDALRLVFEQGSIAIPDDEDLIEELESYEYEILPSGALRYSAPEGKHDDLVIAVGLANWGARSVPLGYNSKPVTHYYLPQARPGVVSL